MVDIPVAFTPRFSCVLHLFRLGLQASGWMVSFRSSHSKSQGSTIMITQPNLEGRVAIIHGQ